MGSDAPNTAGSSSSSSTVSSRLLAKRCQLGSTETLLSGSTGTSVCPPVPAMIETIRSIFFVASDTPLRQVAPANPF